MAAATVTPRQLHEIRGSGKTVDLIDVRAPAEFGEAHVEGARLVPPEALDPPLIARLAGRATARCS